ncbi:MAG TPA: DUF4442 domain-containing protein [Saprospiraceae bacterium]|nr:DUF4442 domain-containing protein [Saprospiraceae bacterium]HNT20697.1 DUF4442 domain-containing protein [Saprospiraceae bacterium]
MQVQTTKMVHSKWMMFWYFLLHLPGAFFFGLKVVSLTEERAQVNIPYRWSTKNPFKSIYFAALAAAAELSTGIIALTSLDPSRISMLVTRVEGQFLKKAKGPVLFECNQVQDMRKTAAIALEQDAGVKIIMNSTGRNREGEVVAIFSFEWSLRKKQAG